MLEFVKYYLCDEKKQVVAVQIPIEDFKRIERAIENSDKAQMEGKSDGVEPPDGYDASKYRRSVIDLGD